MAKPSVVGVRLFEKDNSASRVHRGDQPVPNNVNHVCDFIEEFPEKRRESYVLSEDFQQLCREENAIAMIGHADDYHVDIITPDGSSKVYFFGEQKGNHIKMSESAMLLDNLKPLVTKAKNPRPLPLKKVTRKDEKSVVADIFVNVRRIISNDGKENEVLSVWCPQYPTKTVSLKDDSGRTVKDVAVFSARTLRLIQTNDIHAIKMAQGTY